MGSANATMDTTAQMPSTTSSDVGSAAATVATTASTRMANRSPREACASPCRGYDTPTTRARIRPWHVVFDMSPRRGTAGAREPYHERARDVVRVELTLKRNVHDAAREEAEQHRRQPRSDEACDAHDDAATVVCIGAHADGGAGVRLPSGGARRDWHGELADVQVGERHRALRDEGVGQGEDGRQGRDHQGLNLDNAQVGHKNMVGGAKEASIAQPAQVVRR